MKLTKTLAAAASGLALTGAVLVAPASAVEDPTPTVTTVSLTGGSLSVDGPATASGSAEVAPGSTITVNVGSTSVVDNRGSLLGWTATGASTDFVKPAITTPATPAYTIPKAVFTWTTGAIATSNGSLTGVTAAAAGSMAAPFAVAAALPAQGGGTYTYSATVTGLVPVNLIVGDYVGTITQSVI